MLVDTLEKIFVSSSYQLVEIHIEQPGYNILLFNSSKPDREEYYLLAEAFEQNEEVHTAFANDHAEKLFDSIRKLSWISRAFEKNCTLILCCQEKTISRSTILQLEEDPYNFKKNVITYTQGEKLGFAQTVADSSPTNKLINEIINFDYGSDFREFKERNKNINNHYSLTMKLMMKLPFLTYSPQEKTLSNLDDDIFKSFSIRQSMVYTSLLETPIDASDAEIDKIINILWGSSDGEN